MATHGSDYEQKLSQDFTEPIWLLDFTLEDREFYVREYPEKPGFLVDMDLIYPEGYSDALSGGGREFQLERIKKRIRQKGIDLDDLLSYQFILFLFNFI